MKNNKNLFRINLIEVKEKYFELKDIFFFLDKLTYKLILKKTSFSKDTVIFINYADKKEYFINLVDVNNILLECYFDFYLKPIFSKIIELPCFNFYRDRKDFGLFFKCLFFAIKNGLQRKLIMEKNFIFISVQNLSNIKNDLDFVRFSQFACEIISSFNLQEIIELFQNFLDISSEVIVFDNLVQKSRSYKRYKQYFDLIFLLEKEKISFLKKKDLSLNFILLISFKNANCFVDTTIYNDNSYILRLPDSLKKLPEIEKECPLFNNL